MTSIRFVGISWHSDTLPLDVRAPLEWTSHLLILKPAESQSVGLKRLSLHACRQKLYSQIYVFVGYVGHACSHFGATDFEREPNFHKG